MTGTPSISAVNKKRELSSPEFSADPKKNKPYTSTLSELDLSDISEMASQQTQQTSSETAATGTETDSSQPHITIPPSEMAKIADMLRETFRGK